MNNIRRLPATLLLLAIGLAKTSAQTTSSTSNLIAQQIPDRTIVYSVSAPGVAKPVQFGLDLAWLSEENIRRGIAFMGIDRVKLIRSSFTPTDSLINGALKSHELNILQQRLHIINTWFGPTTIVLNDDNPTVSPWYTNPDGSINASRWAQLIDVTTKLHQDDGHTVITVSPFNEPDYPTGQGDMQDFLDIAAELKANSRFNNIRISGGNTLNTDQALPWYDFLKSKLDEGNTHQLAGSFENFARFFQTVRANGQYATDDEMHNVMEAMVGAAYGMQTGIWWGTAELARGEFVKASDGVRLGYAEHRPNWTAASVYRNLDGQVQAFGGTSERQATTTTFRFVSKDRDVYYDGYGPQREYILSMPGGSGYATGQTNAERVINITWGEDIQPVVDGRYILVNRNSGKVLELAGGSTLDGANVQQASQTGATYQQWDVTPVDPRIGGDFSYLSIKSAHSGKSLDDFNFSLDNGGNLAQWSDTKNANQQWYLVYAGDGWFYIRNRHSAKCIDVLNSSNAVGANVVQWEVQGGNNQQWRFLPIDAAVEFTPPNAPADLTAVVHPASVQLHWSANTEADLKGYTILRAPASGGPFNTIARNVTNTSFVDNTADSAGGPYFYKIMAVDKSLNRSACSNEVAATPSDSNSLITNYLFDGNTVDTTVNLYHCAAYGSVTYSTGKTGQSISLNGNDAFIQLPATIANEPALTVATWVYWNGGNSWQRIFDFGNDQDQYMFLTPSSGAGTLRFAIKNGGAEQILDAPSLPAAQWSHIAVAIDASGAYLYVNGQLAAQSGNITIIPPDFKPVLNYIGRSQFNDPLLNGLIDDFKIFNYALSAGAIRQLVAVANPIHIGALSISSIPGTNAGMVQGNADITITNKAGSPVQGAAVTGQFTGFLNETITGVTDATGRISLKTTTTAEPITPLTFCVTHVTCPTGIYDSTKNVATCKTLIITDVVQPNGISIYPTLTNKKIIIKLDRYIHPLTYSMVDITGKVHTSGRLLQTHTPVDISALGAGIYIVRIYEGSSLLGIQKIIKL